MKQFLLSVAFMLLMLYKIDSISAQIPVSQDIKSSPIQETPDRIPDTGHQEGILSENGQNVLTAPSEYCTASGGCSEHISRVQFGTMDNVSGCSNYSDYTQLVPTVFLPYDQTMTVTVTNGAPYTGDQCGIWVDWNNDGDFSDANETLTVVGSPGNGPYTALIDPPTGSVGDRRMRIRITWTGAVSPCGTTTYGEVEDYRIYVASPGINYWTGRISNNWHTPGNWSLNSVPNSSQDAYILSLNGRDPVISEPADCKNLAVASGHSLTHNSGMLVVTGHMDTFFGSYLMTDAATTFFNGTTDQYWWIGEYSYYTNVWMVKPTTSKVLVSHGGAIKKQLDVSGGILELMENTSLTVGSGLSTDAVIVQSFVSPSVDGSFKLNSYSNLTIIGNLQCQEKSNIIMDGGTIFCRGDFIFNNDAGYNINLTGGTFYFHGTRENQYLTQTNAASLTFGDVRVDKFYNTNKVFLGNKNMKISGDLYISSGVLSCANGPAPTAWYNINIGGDWTNQNFPDGFIPGSGKVIFDGTGTQNINSSENFNTLEVNRSGAIGINTPGTTVTCNSYNWISGGLEALNGASFTALDLAQQGLFGSYRVNAGSTLNLYQDNTQWVDLDANVVFDGGGTINVYGGNGDSWWAFSRNALLTMNGGVLDLKNNGITINNSSYTLNVNLSGDALVRTVGGISMNRPGFAPASGTFEMYGSTDRNISLGTTNSLPNVIINKSAKGDNDRLPSEPVFDARSGLMLTGGTRANQVSLSTNARVTGDLTVMAGTLSLNGRTLTADKNVTVYGTLKMTHALDILNAGTSQVHDLAFKNGSVASITQGNLNVYGWLTTEEGCSFILLETVLVSFKGITGGGPDNRELSARYGSVSIDKNPGHAAYISNWSTQPVTLLGDLTIKASNSFYMQDQSLIIFSNFYDTPTSAVFLNFASASAHASGEESRPGNPGSRGGYLAFYSDVTLNGTLNMGDGELIAYGTFNTANTSSIIINNGYFRSVLVQPDTWNIFSGNLNMTAGIIEMENSTLVFNGMPKIVSDGMILLGSNFIVNTPGIFQPSGGSVSFISNYNDRQLTCSNGNFFNNLDINASNPDYLLFINQPDPLNIAHDFNNYSGYLYSNGNDIYVGGNWFNWGGYHPAGNMVVFNGSFDQSVSGSNTFYDLQNDKSGGSLQFLDLVTVDNNFYANNQNLVNAPYFNIVNRLDLSSGSLQIDNGTEGNVTTNSFLMGGSLEVQSGRFTADDIENNGIFGNITLNGADAVCNLNQDFSQYTDLNGNITIHNGLLKISGGSDVSYWPYFGSASLTMDGGTLDFNGPGILINTTGEFTNSIGGGTIRTAGTFIVDRADYTPWGGTTELYSDVTSYVNTMGGGNLHHLTIHKTPEEGYMPVSYKDRNGKNVSMVRGGAVEISGNLHVAGILDIQEGTLKTVYPGITLTCGTNTGAASVIIQDGGTLELGPLATLKLENGLMAQASGKFSSPGYPEAESLITRAGVNNYYFNVSADASFAADYTIFEYMNPEGIRFHPGSFIEPGHAFNYCTFRNGAPGGTLLNISNHQDLVSTGVHFAENTTGSLYNVTKSENQGYITFTGYTGPFAGPGFENDPFDRIEWYATTPVQTISLPAGWSGLSSYIMPDETSLPALFAPIGANLSILQTLTGVYYPSAGINTIGNWSSQSAYLIKTEAASSLPFTGLPEHNKTLNLANGWNLIPVICNANVTPSSLFSGLGSDLMIVKEAAGSRIYWPGYGIATLENLTPGKSYFVRMNTPGSVTFPNNTDAGSFTPFEPENDPATPWNTVVRTASGHVTGILAEALQALEEGDILGVFTPEGICAGVAQIHDLNINSSVVAFADDALTPSKDGFGAGDEMMFRIFRPSTGEEWVVTPVFDNNLPDYDGTFSSEGISMIREFQMETTGIGSHNPVLSVFPNPATSYVTVQATSAIENIRIYNPVGALEREIDGNGQTRTMVDLSGFPSGIYQLRITLSEGIMISKIVKQ